MCAKSERSFLCRAKTGCVSGKAGRLALFMSASRGCVLGNQQEAAGARGVSALSHARVLHVVALGSACSTHIPDERRGGTGELLFSMQMVLFVCAVPGKSFPLLGGLQGRSMLSEGGQGDSGAVL